jgi:hypothetical protein
MQRTPKIEKINPKTFKLLQTILKMIKHNLREEMYKRQQNAKIFQKKYNQLMKQFQMLKVLQRKIKVKK